LFWLLMALWANLSYAADILTWFLDR
jgi:hypothetical protein